jgi:hypothetical protein
MSPTVLAANVLAPAHHPAPAFHLLGIHHHFTPSQGGTVAIVAVVLLLLLGLWALLRTSRSS